MARGGLAGVWDRNKKWMTPVSELALGLIPGVGPLAAAGLGAAVGAFDRPGQASFKGLGMKNLGNAAMGGLSGYGMGSTGAALKGGLSKLLTAKGAMPSAAPAQAATSAATTPAYNLTGGVGADVFGKTAAQASDLGNLGFSVSGGAPKIGLDAMAPSKLSQLASGIGDFATKYPGATAAAIQGGLGAWQGGEQLAYQRKQDELERQRREAMAQMYAPFAQYLTGKLQ